MTKSTYAKFIDGELKFISSVPYISDCTEEQLAEYATEKGYKLYVLTDCPGRFYNQGTPKETETEIIQTWIPCDLDDAKNSAKEQVQYELTSSLSVRDTIKCEGIENGIVYDSDALINAMGMEVGDPFIDALDGIHMLTEDDLKNIRTALKNHRAGLYMNATVKREAIDKAVNVDEVEQALL